MAKINDTTTYPNTTPALTDHVIGTDVSDTGNSADGEVVTFLLGDIVKLGGFKGLQVFTSSGTWNKPTGVNSVLVFVTGGGGGGAASTDGASGATAIKRLDVTGVSASTITVGAVGVYNVGPPAGNGGASSWSDGTNTVTGGGGGVSGGVASATGGDINLKSNSNNTSRTLGSFWGASYGKGGTGGGSSTSTAGIVVVFEFG